MRRFLAAAAALALCAGVYADIEAYLDCYYQATVPPGDDSYVPDFNDGTYYTVDLRVIVWNDDDWTSSCARATIESGVFFEHPLGDDTPPLAGLVGIYPALEFDSFYASTRADPRNQPPYADPSGQGGYNEPQLRVNEAWWTTPPNAGDGDFLNARYTVHALPDELPVTFHIEGANTTFDGGGTLYPFDLTCVIPEPGSLALLGLALALIRRR